MDSRTGETYLSRDEALKAGVPEEDIVEVQGSERAVQRVSEASRILAQMFPKARRWSL